MKKVIIGLLAFLIVIFVLAGGVYVTYDQIVNVDTIYKGISVNGVDVSNLTKDEALKKVMDQDDNKDRNLVLTYGEYEFKYPYSSLGYEPNYKEGVEEAYKYGRSGTPGERFVAVTDLRKNPLNIKIGKSFNEDHVTEVITHLNNVISTPPVNATFSVVNGEVIISDEQEGVNVSNEKTKELILNSIYSKEPIKVPVNKTPALITAKSFDALKGEIGTYQTNYSLSVPNRKANIKLAASLIDGTVVNPGQQISFNDIIGEISAATGFLPATVINEGEYDTGIGGGICQVSTTLYLAAVSADLQIDERRNHSRPVNYVPMGMDAAVASGYLDLKFTNTFDFPILISAKADDDNIVFSIIGDNEKKNYDIEVVSERTSVLESKTRRENTSSLFEGDTEVKVAGYTGYKYQNYKIKKVDGQEVSRTAYHGSTYPSRDTIISVGTRPYESQEGGE